MSSKSKLKAPVKKQPAKKDPPKKDPPRSKKKSKYYSAAQTKSKEYKTRGGGQQHASDYSIENVMEAPAKGGGKGAKVVTGRGSMHDPIHGVADLLNLHKD